MTSSPHSQYLWQRWTVNGTTVISCSLGVNDVSVVSRSRRRHLAKSCSNALRAGVHHGGKCVYVTSRCDDELHKAAAAAAAPPTGRLSTVFYVYDARSAAAAAAAGQ